MARFGPVVIERHGPGGSTEENGHELIDLRDILRDHDVVDVMEEERVIIVAPSNKRFAMPRELVGKELGAAGSSFRRLMGAEDYNLSLSGHRGIEIYDRMRRSDGTVRQSLRIAKTPVLAGRWFVESHEPGEKQHDEIAEFIEGALFKWQSISWFNLLTEALLMLDFGYYVFEKVFTMREVPVGDGSQVRAVWQKWAPRHPLDIEEWEFDKHGGVDGGWFDQFEGADPVFIPIKKLLIYTYDREGGNIEGISLLRSAYKHWYFKDNLYKIDAIQKERHGIGVPIIKLPPNYTPDDKRLANELGRNLRTNERAHIVLPPMWELEFADIKGSVVDIAASIDHHDNAIVRNVLANFVGTETSAAAVVQVELFLKATRFIADIIADVVNKFAIPELVDYNYPGVVGYPTLGVRRIGETADWRTLSFAIRNFVGANIIAPDDPLEEWVRKEMDLPQADPDTTREVATPQAGGARVGPPRQSPPSAKPGAGTGNDRSGG
jgi:hypothetical protein